MGSCPGVQGKADLHVHTKFSGVHKMGPLRFPESVSDPVDVVRKAKAAGMDVVCITDHNSVAGAHRAVRDCKDIKDISIVIGEEVSSADGEILAYFIEDEIPAGLSAVETIERIREQGGLTVAPHPFSLHCPCLKDQIFDLDLDGIEILNGGHIDDYANSHAQEIGRQEVGRWALTGGSDSHCLKNIGATYTLFEGNTPEDLRKSILNKTTSADGEIILMNQAIAWSIEVIVHSDKLILRSFFGLDKEKIEDDPIVYKVHKMKLGQKLGALFGSLVYFTPPIPFVAGGLSKVIFKKLEKHGINDSEMFDIFKPFP